MNRRLTLWGVALLLLAMTAFGARGRSSASPCDPQDDPKKILPEIEGAKKSAKKIAPAAQAKIEKALGEKLAAADLAPLLFEGKAQVPVIDSKERTRVVVCILSVKGPKGEIRLGVAAAPEERFLLAVKVLKNDDDKYVESPPFLRQFKELEYTDHLYNGPDVLAAARKKQKEGDKDVGILLDTMEAMRGVGVHWDWLQEKLGKSDASAADEAAALKKSLEDVQKMIPRMAFLRQSKADSFKKNVSKTAGEFDKILGMIKGGKYVEAQQRAGELEKSSCDKCHADTQRSFREQRFKNGVGYGYFSIGLDVSSPDDKKECVQAVANGIHKALLLIAEAR